MDLVAVRLGRVLGIRPGEGPLVVRVALVFAVMEAARGFGEVGVDTLLLGRFGPDGLPQVLPYLFIALGSVGLVVALGYGAALGRLPRVPLFVGILGAIAAIVIALRSALAGGDSTIVSILWLTIKAAGMLAMTMYWTVAGASFDARQAKRLFPVLTGAAIAGSFVGTLGAGPVARLAGVETLVVVEAALLAVAAALIARVPRRAAPPKRKRAPSSIVSEVRAGFDFVVRSRLMSLVAVAYVLLAVLAFSVENPFLIAASSAFPTDVEVATALGLLSAAITATSFIVSVTLANRLYARFGITVGALILPIVYLAGFGVWLIQFSFATAAIFRFAQQVTQRGISNAAWSGFYNTVPAERRAQVLAFIDGVPGQIGTILAGILLLAAGQILAPEQVFWLGAATAVLATAVVIGIRRRYAGSLLQALRAGAGEQVLEGGPGIEALARDPSVGQALLAALQAPEPGVREIAASLLARVSVDGSGDALIAALGDDDARVRAAAIRALATLGREPVDIDHAALAADPSPIVRAAAIVAHAGHDELAARAFLSDPSPDVRAAAIAVVTLDGDIEPAVLAALDDDSTIVRHAAAAALGASAVDGSAVIGMLTVGSVRAQRAALTALVGIGERDPRVGPAVADWAHRRLTRASELQGARLALASTSPSVDPVADFLVFVLEGRQRDLAGTALEALAVLGAPEARGVVRRCLHSDDMEVRAQAMEALDSIGDRRLAGALVRLLEGETTTAPGTAGDALRRLAHDEDDWIGALAQRCNGAGGGNDDMTGTERTLTDLHTMLLLRRVPLFEGLDPEDLQRIAASSEERTYAGGETVLREGDLGDELVVIVTGSVRVVRTEDDGSDRFIRRYEAGEHIGELAVLRERPRAATVIAEDGGMRGLVIGGEGLKSILRERPDAAMAMLATLAERVSLQ